MSDNSYSILRVELGALLALKELAELGQDPETLADFADLTIRAVAQALDFELTESFTERLKDENLFFITSSGLLSE
jgi:hypothetical protein